jgi:uncharacterized membrane protein YqgA involved in biofilm formation
MTGTLLNVATILIGGILGLFLGKRLPERLRQTVVIGLGLFTMAYGISMFLKNHNPLISLGSILLGAILGEWWQIEQGLRRFGAWMEGKVQGSTSGDESKERFIRGFLTSSLVFVVGPMAILGSIQDGLTGDFSLLAIKSILDGFGALAFASSLGIGVLFSIIPTLVYQGAISLLAYQVQSVASAVVMDEMSAVGGIILLGIALGSLLEIKPIRAANFIPALVLSPLITILLSHFGWIK